MPMVMRTQPISASALFAAARGGHESTVRLRRRGAAPIMEDNSDDNSVDNSEDNPEGNLFHWCAESGLVSVIEELLASGAYRVDQVDDSGKAPLHHAAFFERGKPALVWLLSKGAQIDLQDELGKTPPHAGL